MEIVLEKALGYLGIILIGYIFKRKQWVGREAANNLSAIMMKLTLPCAILMNMNGMNIEHSLYFLILLGILYNGFTLLLGYMANKSKGDKAFAMINLSGFNLGGFAIPFVSGFISEYALLATCMFDVGNSLMCLGINGGIATSVIKGKNTINLKDIARKMSESIPIWTYVIILFMSLCNVEIPEVLILMIQPISQANPMLAMLIIGISVELSFEGKKLKTITKCLVFRFISALSMAVISVFLLLPKEIVDVLIILCFSPISAATLIYTKELELEFETSACINSLYLLISIIMMCSIVSVFQRYK